MPIGNIANIATIFLKTQIGSLPQLIVPKDYDIKLQTLTNDIVSLKT